MRPDGFFSCQRGLCHRFGAGEESGHFQGQEAFMRGFRLQFFFFQRLYI